MAKKINRKMAKKQHIVNDKKSYCCGLKSNPFNKHAVWEKDTLYDHLGYEINHTNMDRICINCLKLFHPTFYDQLISAKKAEERKNSIPKNKLERLKAKRNRSFKVSNEVIRKNRNVIHLPYVPVAITDTRRLLEYVSEEKCRIIKPAKQKPIETKLSQELIEAIETDSIDDDVSYLEFDEGIAMIRGFNNQWQVIIEIDGMTEALTNWIPYGSALNEVSQLVSIETTNNQTKERINHG